MTTSDPDSDSQARKTVRLTPEEVAVLRRSLEKHRATIPSYLQSMHREMEVIGALLKRLE